MDKVHCNYPAKDQYAQAGLSVSLWKTQSEKQDIARLLLGNYGVHTEYVCSYCNYNM